MVTIEQGVMEKIIDYRIIDAKALMSIVVVTYNREKELGECLDSLKNQTFKDFEIIIIDNGEIKHIMDQLRAFNVLYIRLTKNYGLSQGRNVGTLYAKTPIVCSLDDDALADSHYAEAHFEAHKKYDIFALRGKSLPKKSGLIYNEVQNNYDLGSAVQEAYINLEGNSSFKKEILLDIGGFNPKFFGYEGTELSCRIVEKFGDRSKLIYYPEAIIYHDYAQSLLDYLEKIFRHEKMLMALRRNYPAIAHFMKSYKKPIFISFPDNNLFRKGYRNIINTLGKGAKLFARIVGTSIIIIGFTGHIS
jgi:GT2 family glycosyltransferase